MPTQPDHEVIITGAGLGGICAAIKLRAAGIEDFVIAEQSDDVGGTWRVNTYPGIAVDVPSFAYQLSSDPNPSWSRVFAPGAEIKAYADALVARHGLREKIRFGTRIERADFDERCDMWVGATAQGPITARYVINATGGLTQPKLPDIPGLDTFAGTTVHTARWDHGHSLRGERVAVIGTGATAVQLVPAIAPLTERLYVYQRTPIWVLPKTDADLRLLRPVLQHLPGAQRALRLAFAAGVEVSMVLGAAYNKQLPQLTQAAELAGRAWIRAQVRDPVLREKLTPRYGFGCKRPSVSNHYFATFNRANTHLITDPIAKVTPTGIKTQDGVHREIDTLVLATGYLTTEPENIPPIPVTGAGGKDLSTFWSRERFQAYEGTSIPGFPNLFLTFGPYTVAGLSILGGIENSTAHAIRVITEAARRGATRVEVRQEPHDRFFELMLRRQRNTIFFNNGCEGANSYYFDRHGDAPLLRPGGTIEAWWRSRHFDLDDYRYELPGAHSEIEPELAAASA